MNVVTEFVKFDDEDRGNIDYEGGECPYGIHRAEKDHMFFLCYYTPEKQNSSLVSGMKEMRPSSVLCSVLLRNAPCDRSDSCMTCELCKRTAKSSVIKPATVSQANRPGYRKNG